MVRTIQRTPDVSAGRHQRERGWKHGEEGLKKQHGLERLDNLCNTVKQYRKKSAVSLTLNANEPAGGIVNKCCIKSSRHVFPIVQHLPWLDMNRVDHGVQRTKGSIRVLRGEFYAVEYGYGMECECDVGGFRFNLAGGE